MPTLMIVDDEALSRFAVRSLIARNFTNVEVVCEAESGTEAVELYERHRPDVVVMDIRIPEMNGLETSRRILANHPRANIIICSAYDSFSLVSQAIDIGVKGYLLKPLRKEETVEKLKKLLYAEYSPIEALAERQILHQMLDGQVDGETLQVLDRYYGTIRSGLIAGFRLPAPDEALEKKLIYAVKKNAPQPGFALVERRAPFIAAFLSPVTEPDSCRERLKNLARDMDARMPIRVECAQVEDCAWADAWRGIESALSEDPAARFLAQFERLIRDEDLRDMSLNRLAGELDITPQYLSAMFKEHTKRNFLDYITQRRMAYAALLVKGGVSVQQVAERCGYADAVYFKRLFKKYYGCTPYKYVHGEGSKP